MDRIPCADRLLLDSKVVITHAGKTITQHPLRA